jgi:hypothetical protein
MKANSAGSPLETQRQVEVDGPSNSRVAKRAPRSFMFVNGGRFMLSGSLKLTATRRSL